MSKEKKEKSAIYSRALDRDRAIGRKDGRSPEEVIAAIDSSGWAVDPVKYGMTAMEYQHGEAELLMGTMQQRAGGVNTFNHFPGVARFGDTWVVSPNNDTIYSAACVDARQGFQVTVPDTGERFISLQVQDFNHTFVDYRWDSGTHRYDADMIDTDYVLVALRIATTGTEEDQAYVRESLQPAASITALSAIPLEPKIDPARTKRVREALLPEYNKLPDLSGAVKYDIRAVDNWEKWTVVVAGGWGLSPDDTAIYQTFAPQGTKGGVCYIASFDPVPAHAFFSLTVYDADQFLMSDEHNMVSSNRPDFISRPDGGFDVVFGGMDCKAIADERGANFAYTPADGWNWLLRSYRPDVEAMKTYRMPDLERIG